MNLASLSDRVEIQEQLARYCHALDLKDWPAFRAVFTPDALLDYSAFGGPAGSVKDIEDFLTPILNGLHNSHHMVSTTQIDLDGDEAKVRSAALVPMTSLTANGTESTLVSGLWYEDHFARTQDGWRIRSRKQTKGWTSSPI